MVAGAATGIDLRQVFVRWNFVQSQSYGFRATGLRQSISVALVNRNPALKVGQRKCVYSVATKRRANKIKKGGVLRDGEQLTIAERPIHWRKIESDYSNFAHVWL